MEQKNYLETIYSKGNTPITDYPKKFIIYLIKRFEIKKKQKVLELGCGRGEFLNEFVNNGLEGYGVDISNYCKEFFPNINFKKTDMSNEKLPYEDNFFDIVYSKSVIEHFYYPNIIFDEAYRVLKPGGMIITLTPEWQYIYKSFYEDFTHRTPFTSVSLRDIQQMSGFKEITVESFKQLPIIFENRFFSKIFYFLSFLTRILVAEKFRMKNKWVRFSKEIMLLSVSKK
jgi:ubiquinone/menaquinone biosynthesis C-methylase UbiE